MVAVGCGWFIDRTVKNQGIRENAARKSTIIHSTKRAEINFKSSAPCESDFQVFRDPIETSLSSFDRSATKTFAHLGFSFDELVKLLQTP
ncbi:ubiquitin-protein ligase [Colletotrichum sp. SAR 10_77]|nr:ubiquitin-protein ligase [Colletotrichum sp. SAR 10_77]KAJ5000223.1 ubiquitin-protein ligase [Colletotrichum sp. SAR 10_66]